jgi:hypothetical protein
VSPRRLYAHSSLAADLGLGTTISEYASIRDSNDERPPGFPMRLSGHRGGPIVIGNEVWIGRPWCHRVGSITIGDGATVGANEVATRDVAAGGHRGRRPRSPDSQLADIGGKHRFRRKGGKSLIRCERCSCSRPALTVTRP